MDNEEDLLSQFVGRGGRELREEAKAGREGPRRGGGRRVAASDVAVVGVGDRTERDTLRRRATPRRRRRWPWRAALWSSRKGGRSAKRDALGRRADEAKGGRRGGPRRGARGRAAGARCSAALRRRGRGGGRELRMEAETAAAKGRAAAEGDVLWLKASWLREGEGVDRLRRGGRCYGGRHCAG